MQGHVKKNVRFSGEKSSPSPSSRRKCEQHENLRELTYERVSTVNLSTVRGSTNLLYS